MSARFWLPSPLLYIRAIITRSRFETALDYKPRILGLIFLVYVLKWYVILTSFALKNGVKNIQTAGYNGARMVYERKFEALTFFLSSRSSSPSDKITD